MRVCCCARTGGTEEGDRVSDWKLGKLVCFFFFTKLFAFRLSSVWALVSWEWCRDDAQDALRTRRRRMLASIEAIDPPSAGGDFVYSLMKYLNRTTCSPTFCD